MTLNIQLKRALWKIIFLKNSKGGIMLIVTRLLASANRSKYVLILISKHNDNSVKSHRIIITFKLRIKTLRAS